MDTEQRLKVLEDEMMNLRNHRHTGVDYPRVVAPDVENKGVYARLTMSASQNISNNTATLVNFDTATYSNALSVSATTMSITVGASGRYLVSSTLNYNATVDAMNYAVMIYVNGTGFTNGFMPSSGTIKQVAPHVSDVLSLEAGDAITIYAIHGAGVSQTITNGIANGDPSYFSMVKIG